MYIGPVATSGPLNWWVKIVALHSLTCIIGLHANSTVIVNLSVM